MDEPSDRIEADAPAAVVLTGMMGTGKSSIGQRLARRWRWSFCDLDERIESSSGMSIARIFELEGEIGFRAREADAVRALVAELEGQAPIRPSADARSSAPDRDASPGSGGMVIATGGWTLADPESRAQLEQRGPVVCLTASAEALATRLAAARQRSRPLLADPDAASLHAMQMRRQHLYDSFVLQVDTTILTPDEATDRVEELVRSLGACQASALPVATPTGGYSVIVGTGLLGSLGTLLRARGLSGLTAVVTDTTVERLHASAVRESLERAGASIEVLPIPPGEASKSLSTVEMLYEQFLATGLARDSFAVALGGGVVTDTAGFAAATYMRGMTLVNVPTSLLGMVDAAIGGKTGVNLPRGKNLVGAFKHPALVVADASVLATLPAPQIRSGLAEVVKSALIGDPALLEALERHAAPSVDDARGWARVVLAAAAVKARIVTEDPEEYDRRMVLNLGHTFGHAIEHATAGAVAHGDAVATGLLAAAELSARLGIASPALPERIERLLVTLGLPTCHENADPHAALESMAIDKKRRSGLLRFVLPAAPGDIRIVSDVPESELLSVLAHRCGRGCTGESPSPS